MQQEKIFQLQSILSLPTDIIRLQMCGTTYPNKNYAIQRAHSSIGCIEYIVRGTGTVTVNGTTFSPVAGDTYFLPLGSTQFYQSDKKDPWEKIWINVSGKMIEQLTQLYRLDGIYHFPKLDTSDLLLKFQYHATHPDEKNVSEKCTSLLNALFFRMYRAHYEEESANSSPVRRMLDYINLHETDVIRIEQLAEVCKKSPSQAERLFRRELGTPPYRYILNRKIELAKELLRETGMSVRDISGYLSFEDEFYFSGLFRRKVGVSPSTYRKMRNEINSDEA